LEGEKEMSGEFYVEIIGWLITAAFTGLYIVCAVWFANFVYDDIVDKRRWRNRK
jgi:hypothetical protein